MQETPPRPPGQGGSRREVSAGPAPGEQGVSAAAQRPQSVWLHHPAMLIDSSGLRPGSRVDKQVISHHFKDRDLKKFVSHGPALY